MATIGNLSAFLGLDSASFTRNLNRARADLNSNAARMNRAIVGFERGATRALGRASRSLFSFRGAIGLVAGTGGLGLLVKSSLATADAIAKVSDAAGVSTKQLQEYRFAADLSGVATEKFDKSLLQFAKRVGEARAETGSLVEFLKKNNAEMVKAIVQSQSTGEALDIVFGAMANLTKQTDRAALAAAAFGRTGVEMTNIVRGGTKELESMRQRARDLGLIISDKLLRSSEQAKDRLTELGAILRTKVTIAVVENADKIADLASALIDRLPAAIDATVSALKTLAEWMNAAGVAAGAIAGASLGTFVLPGIGTAIGALLGGAGAALLIWFNDIRATTFEIGNTTLSVGIVMDAVWTTVSRVIGGTVEGVVALAAALGALVTGDFEGAVDRWDQSARALFSALTGPIDAFKQARKEIKALEVDLGGFGEGITTPRVTSDIADMGRTIADVGDQAEIAGDKLVELTAKVRLLGAARKKFEQVEVETIQRMRDENHILGLLAEGRKDEVQRLTQLKEAFAILNDIKEDGGRIDDNTLNNVLRELEARDELTKKIDAQAKAQERIREAREEAARAAERQAEEMRRPFLNAAEDIQRGFTDTFFQIFRGTKNRDLVGDFLDFVQDAFARMLANLATLALIRPIIIPVVGALGGALGLSAGDIGSVTSGLGGGLFGGGGLNGGFGLGQLGSLINFGPGGVISEAGAAINSLGASLGFAAAAPGGAPLVIGPGIGTVGLTTPAASGLFGGVTLSSVLGGAGLGFGAGAFLNSLLGGNQTGGLVGSGVGALGGALLGSIIPGVGTILGGLLGGAGGGILGGLFGGGRTVGPVAEQNLDIIGGRVVLATGAADNGGDLASLSAAAQQLAAGINQLVSAFDLTLRNGRTAVGGGFKLFSGGARAAAEILGRNPNSFTTPQAAITGLLQAGVISSNDPRIAGVLRRSTAANVESNLEFARSVLALSDTTPALTLALDEINKRFDAMINRARSLGLATDGLIKARDAELVAIQNQARAPFFAAAGSLVDFVNARRLGPESSLSPTDRLTEAQRQFGDLLSRVRGGEIGLTGNLQQVAGTLLTIGRENFGPTVNFANLERSVESSLLSIAANFSDPAFIDQQIAATQQSTNAIVAAEAETTAAVESLRREIQLLRQQLAA